MSLSPDPLKPQEAYELVTSAYQDRLCFPLDIRRENLKRLAYAVEARADKIRKALLLDIGQNALEADLTQLNSVYWEIVYFLDNLSKLAKTETPPLSFAQPAFALYTTFVRKEPLGPVLIISPYNYPFKLAMDPLIAAIAAGCPAIVKPSELSSHTAEIIAELVRSTLDPRCYGVIFGGKEVVELLLEKPWGKVFFTGSGAVGKAVSVLCAKTLTPVDLELGGKSPVIIDKGYDIELAAKRTLTYKLMNLGQTCTSVDYVLLPPSLQQPYIDACLALLTEWFPDPTLGELVSDAKIPTQGMIDRLERLLDGTKGRIVRRGKVDREGMKMGVSIVADVEEGDILLNEKEEIFGPILVISPSKDLATAVSYVAKNPAPLGVYLFSNSQASIDYTMDRTQSGSFIVNDCAQQALVPSIPFGGVGASGHGSYHGKYGFDLFTQQRGGLVVPNYLEPILGSRYPPATKSKHRLLQAFLLPLSLPFADPSWSPSKRAMWWVRRKSWKPIFILSVLLGLVRSGILSQDVVLHKALAYIQGLARFFSS